MREHAIEGMERRVANEPEAIDAHSCLDWAHELYTPLTPVIVTIQVLRRSGSALGGTPIDVEVLDSMERNLWRLKDGIDRLLMAVRGVGVPRPDEAARPEAGSRAEGVSFRAPFGY